MFEVRKFLKVASDFRSGEVESYEKFIFCEDASEKKLELTNSHITSGFRKLFRHDCL